LKHEHFVQEQDHERRPAASASQFDNIEYMEPGFVLILLVLCSWSVITSFSAIIRILTNDFNGSKVEWIIISMIAFIGPLLWMIKGKKKLVKK
jgi:hypothetical protein